MNQKTRPTVVVVVVDEQELFRRGLCTALKEAGLKVTEEYSSAPAIMAAEEGGWELEPGTVVLCSVALEGWEELVHHLHLRAPACPIVGLVDKATDEVAVKAVGSGMVACLERTLPREEWVKAVTEVHAGRVSPALMLLQHPAAARHALMLLSQPVAPPGLHPLAPVLAHRERLALAHLSEGVRVEVMAEQMGVPEQALHEVLLSACRKLVARRRLPGALEQLR